MSNKLSHKLSYKTPSYLINRNGIFYFSYRLPVSSTDKPKIIRYSLKTRDPLVARERISKLIKIVKTTKEADLVIYEDKLCDKLKSEVKCTETGLINKMAKNHQEPLDINYLYLDIEEIELAYLEIALLDIDTYKDRLLERMNENYNFDTAIEYSSAGIMDRYRVRKVMLEGIVSDIKNVRSKLEPCLIKFAELYDKYGEDELNAILNLHFEYKWDLIYRLDYAVLSDDDHTFQSIISGLNAKFQRMLVEKNNEIQKEALYNQNYKENHQISTQDKHVISHYMSDFLSWDEDERSRKPEIVRGYQRDLEFLICVIGDKPINLVTIKDIKDTLKIKKSMPVLHKKPYKDLGVEHIVGLIKNNLFEAQEDDLVASKTVRETLKSYQSFFSSFLVKKLNLLEKAPTDNVTYKFKSDPYANYDDEQMNLIVDFYKNQLDAGNRDKAMVVLTATYTGMRLSEICDLTKDSIQYEQKTNTPYIDIKKGKTKAAIRKVPISNKLKEVGLIEYLNNLRGQRLFTKKTDLVTEDLKKTRELLSIPHEDEYQQRRVFHSLRHSFITKTRAKGVTDVQLQKVVGHQIPKSITDRYTHSFSVKDLAYIVEVVDW